MQGPGRRQPIVSGVAGSEGLERVLRLQGTSLRREEVPVGGDREQAVVKFKVVGWSSDSATFADRD